MNKNRSMILGFGVIALVIIAALFAGGFVDIDSGVWENSQEEQNRDGTEQNQGSSDGDKPAKMAGIEIDRVNISERQNGTYEVRVQMTVQAYGYENLSNTNVMGCLYDTDGTELHSKNIGSIRPPESGEFYRQNWVNATVPRRPAFILADHPTLRSDGPPGTEIRKWDSERETYTLSDYQTLRTRFDFPRTNESGTCG